MSMSGAEVRKKILEQVEGCVCRDRNNSYGDAIDNFRNIADLWEVYIRPKLAPGAHITPCDVAMMSGLIKVARAIHSPEYLDSWVDLAGYAVCGAGIVTQEKEAEDVANDHDAASAAVTLPPK